MRARLARPRRIVRGRLVAPVATAAAVALVAGVVVATPDAPTLRSDVQTVAVTAPVGQVGTEVSFNLAEIVSVGQWADIQITDVTGLPDGLSYAGGVISGLRGQGAPDAVVGVLSDGFADATRLTLFSTAGFLVLGLLAAVTVWLASRRSEPQEDGDGDGAGAGDRPDANAEHTAETERR